MLSTKYTLLQNGVKSSRFLQKILVGVILAVFVFLVNVVMQNSSAFEGGRIGKIHEKPTQSSKIFQANLAKTDSIQAVIKGFNRIGQMALSDGVNWTSRIHETFGKLELKDTQSLIRNLTTTKIVRDAKSGKNKRIKKTGPRINVATIMCGKGRLVQGLTMIKSASMFAQDASLNVIVFSDAETIVELGLELFLLRRMVNAAGWDFTFELHLEWFPPKTTGKAWREMYQPCATMRLFFPDLLPHIDSIIYLDTDVVVMSNLTEMWNKISDEMGDRKMAAAAPNVEPNAVNWYTYNKFPHVGKQGINAGIMLMNLTQMRDFNISSRAMGIKRAFAEKLILADQDIYNAIFHAYDDRFLLLSCTYNLNSVHCDRGTTCNWQTKQDTCFCEDARKQGMHVIHGCQQAFWKTLARDHFIPQAYRQFKDFQVMKETPFQLLANIKKEFKPQPNCYNVDFDMVYKNAEVYFAKLYKVNGIH